MNIETNVPILGFTKRLTSIEEDLKALGISTRDQNFAKTRDLRNVGEVLKEGEDDGVYFEKAPMPKQEKKRTYVQNKLVSVLREPPKVSSLQEDFKKMGISLKEQLGLDNQLFEEKNILEDAYRDDAESSYLQLAKEPEEYSYEGSPVIHRHSIYSFNKPHNFQDVPKVTHIGVTTSYHPKTKAIETMITGKSLGNKNMNVEPLHQETFSDSGANLYHHNHDAYLKDLGLTVKQPKSEPEAIPTKPEKIKTKAFESVDVKKMKYNSYDIPKHNPKRKDSLQQRPGADSGNRSRTYPVPSIDKHKNNNESIENPWEQLDTQKKVEEAMAQKFLEQTMSGNVGAFAVPMGGMIRRYPSPLPGYSEVVPKSKKKKKLKEDISYEIVDNSFSSLMEEASNPATSINRLKELSESRNVKIRTAALTNPSLIGKIVKNDGLKFLTEEVRGSFIGGGGFSRPLIKEEDAEKCNCPCHKKGYDSRKMRVHCFGPCCNEAKNYYKKYDYEHPETYDEHNKWDLPKNEGIFECKCGCHGYLGEDGRPRYAKMGCLAPHHCCDKTYSDRFSKKK